jgi:hypothetical protein
MKGNVDERIPPNSSTSEYIFRDSHEVDEGNIVET